MDLEFLTEIVYPSKIQAPVQGALARAFLQVFRVLLEIVVDRRSRTKPAGSRQRSRRYSTLHLTRWDRSRYTSRSPASNPDNSCKQKPPTRFRRNSRRFLQTPHSLARAKRRHTSTHSDFLPRRAFLATRSDSAREAFWAECDSCLTRVYPALKSVQALFVRGAEHSALLPWPAVSRGARQITRRAFDAQPSSQAGAPDITLSYANP